MLGITKKQKEVLDFITQYIRIHQFSPSYREIMENFQFNSIASVYKHIKALKKKQMLLGKKGAARSLIPYQMAQEEEKPAFYDIPFIGYLSLGFPIQTLAETKSIQIPSSLIKNPSQSYALRIRGDALKQDLICDGDLLLIEAKTQAAPGEIILATIEQETILKRYYPEGSYVRLESLEASNSPQTIPLKDIQIQAVCLGILRLY